jgi:hypothetical protein
MAPAKFLYDFEALLTGLTGAGVLSDVRMFA